VADAIVSQDVLELAETSVAAVVVSQDVIELAETSVAAATVSQYVVETVMPRNVPAVISQYVVEIITGGFSETLAWGLEADLSGIGLGWTLLTPDVRASDGIQTSYGISGSDPTDRTASTGTLRFTLDNSTRNSAGLIGYYSPFHSNRRAGWDYNIPVRWWLWFHADRKYKHLGKLSDILPAPGIHEARNVRCQSLDWMDDAARIDVPDLATQTNQRADEVLTTILDAMTTQPAAREFDTGIDTFKYVLDGGTGQRLKVREELNKLALSEQGYVYIKGDYDQGGTLAFEARGHRANDTTTHLSFDDDMSRDGLVIVGGRDDVYRTVQVTVHPTRVDSAATTVLFSLVTTSTLVGAGETLDTIFGPYRDPDTNEACGGTAMVTPVATTDYTMNSAEDGLGSDLTGNFTVTASYTGQGVRYTIVNGGGTPGYITKLQARGKGVYRKDVNVEKTVSGSYGDRVLSIDMPYQTSVNIASNLATYLATLLSTPSARVRSIKFCANRSDDFMTAAIVREPGDKIAITETVTGLMAAEFHINRVTLEMHANNILWCQWELVPAGLDPWWIGDGGGGDSDFAAIGGTITTSGGYTYHTFQADDDFEVTAGSASVQYLIVGAGGSGGDLRGGGGGGGGVLTGSFSVSVGAYPVVIGQGSSGNNGGNSTAFSQTAIGGGKGSSGSGIDGSSGASGGGGSDVPSAGGAGTSGQGYAGGDGGKDVAGDGDAAGGGGGGAGGPGNSSNDFSSNGGPGRDVWGTYYGGGGGGNQDLYSGSGGAGGAGRGGAGGNPSEAGTDYTGGGGGGGENKKGGHGVVIIRYPTA
jgi:hypothetical protein